MSLPREPRQKMINMMYLVLTALLALNVSSEILNAFKTVNKSLETTNAVVNTSTADIMKSLQEKTTDETSKVKAANLVSESPRRPRTSVLTVFKYGTGFERSDLDRSRR